MAEITIQKFSTVGVGPSYTAAAAGGDNFVNNGSTYYIVKNSSASPVTVTFNSVEPCSYGFDHDQIETVAAGATKQIGPFNPKRFNDNTTGKVSVTYSAVATVTVAALDLT